MEQVPTIGRIVRYKLTTSDLNLHEYNGLSEGHEVAAVIVRGWGNDVVNLRLYNDCSGDLPWKTSVSRGDDPGQWNWPERT